MIKIKTLRVYKVGMFGKHKVGMFGKHCTLI